MSDKPGRKIVRVWRALMTFMIVTFSLVSFLKFGSDPEILQQISKNPIYAFPLIGLLAWSGIYLRDRCLWKLIPIRRKTVQSDECSSDRLD